MTIEENKLELRGCGGQVIELSSMSITKTAGLGADTVTLDINRRQIAPGVTESIVVQFEKDEWDKFVETGEQMWRTLEKLAAEADLPSTP